MVAEELVTPIGPGPNAASRRAGGTVGEHEGLGGFKAGRYEPEPVLVVNHGLPSVGPATFLVVASQAGARSLESRNGRVGRLATASWQVNSGEETECL